MDLRIEGFAIRKDRFGIERWLGQVTVNGKVVAQTSRLSERHAVAWAKAQVVIIKRRLGE